MAERTCSIDGCPKAAEKRGWCNPHYQRWRLKGAPGEAIQPPARRRVAPNGYIHLYRPGHPLAMSDGYVAEHRMVAWDCGILTDPADHVHHVNEDKTDNRPENLDALHGSEHRRHHIAKAGFVENQYGAWPVRNRGAA